MRGKAGASRAVQIALDSSADHTSEGLTVVLAEAVGAPVVAASTLFIWCMVPAG